MNSDWLTPAQLAEELGRPTRWIEDHMTAGDIPSVRIGRFRYFTPECRARLVETQLASKTPLLDEAAEIARSWGRPDGSRPGRRAG